MQAYHEKEPGRLSEKQIYLIRSVTHKKSTGLNLHWHNSYEILYVRRGFGEQQINHRSFSFSPGSVVIICPGDIHATMATSSDGYEIDVLQFVDGYLGERWELLSGLAPTVITPTEPVIGGLFDQIINTAYSTGAGDQLILSGAVFTLCGHLLELCPKAGYLAGRTKFTTKVCHALAEQTDLHLKTVSRQFGYSPEHFSRKFQKEAGISFQQYCEKIKMQRIMQSLAEHDVSIEALAVRAGYSDASSFTRAFKRIYGMTPGVYRKLKNDGNTLL